MKRKRQIEKQKSLSSYLRGQKKTAAYVISVIMPDYSTKTFDVSEEELQELIKMGLLNEKIKFNAEGT